MKQKITPPTYFMLLLLLSIALHFILPLEKIINPPYAYSGILLIIFGIILNLWADSLFKKSKTTVSPHDTPTSLETEGPFRATRHPMYLGMAAILFGAAILMGTITPFLSPVLFIILMEALFIPAEEKNMENQFKTRHHTYKKKVRRWI